MINLDATRPTAAEGLSKSDLCAEIRALKAAINELAFALSQPAPKEDPFIKVQTPLKPMDPSKVDRFVKKAVEARK